MACCVFGREQGFSRFWQLLQRGRLLHALLLCATRHGALLLLVLAFLAGCTQPTPRPSARVAPLPSTPREPIVYAAPNAWLFEFAGIKGDLERTCAKSPKGQTSLDMGQGDGGTRGSPNMIEAAGAEKECLEKVMRAALEDAASHLEPGAASELREAQKEHDRFIDDVCWLTEEGVWVDLDEGWRDDGSLRNFAWISCAKQVRIEQAFLLRSIARNNARGFARHVETQQASGREELGKLRGQGVKARALLGLPVQPVVAFGGPTPLDMPARHLYVERVAAVERAMPELARRTCEVFPHLREAYAGDGACEKELVRYYASLGDYASRVH